MRPSKGKRDKRLKRKRNNDKSPTQEGKAHALPPKRPEQASFLDIGLASVSRSLGGASSLKLSGQPHAQEGIERTERSYAAVFVIHGGQSSVFTSNFPRMISLACDSQPPERAIRLIGLSEDLVQDRLSHALGVPRVTTLGLLESCPGSEAIVEFVRQHVPLVDIPWLREVQDGSYQFTKIKTVQVPVGARKIARKTLPIIPQK